MKKEIIVTCFLILILAAAFINIHYLDKLTEDVAVCINDAVSLASDEKWRDAEIKAEEAVKLWLNSDTYTHIVLRHAEIESATDLIYGFIQEVYAKETGAAIGAAQAAVERLKSIASIEHVKFGSVF